MTPPPPPGGPTAGEGSTRRGPLRKALDRGVTLGGTLEHAQEMAAHESPRTTKLYDRTKERLDEVERVRLGPRAERDLMLKRLLKKPWRFGHA